MLVAARFIAPSLTRPHSQVLALSPLASRLSPLAPSRPIPGNTQEQEYQMTTSAERIDPARTALIAYDVCKRILTPADPAARERMRPALESWAVLINACRELK